MILYHGSKKGIDGEIKPQSSKNCDFGKGFYMTESREQALAAVCDCENPIIYTLEADFSDITHSSFCNKHYGLLTIDFDYENDNWLVYVGYHKGFINSLKFSAAFRRVARLRNNCDLIIGPALDSINISFLNMFCSNMITDKDAADCIKSLRSLINSPARKQYAAVSSTACSRIKIIKTEYVSEEERLAFKKKQTAQSAELCSCLNALPHIKYKYKRPGRYIDEVIKEPHMNNKTFLDYDTYEQNLTETQGDLFVMAMERGYDCPAFIEAFMNDETAEELALVDHFRSRSAAEILNFSQSLRKVKKAGTVYCDDIMYWIGTLYNYWHFYNGEEAAKIYKIADAETMEKAYHEFRDEYFDEAWDYGDIIDELTLRYYKRRRKEKADSEKAEKIKKSESEADKTDPKLKKLFSQLEGKTAPKTEITEENRLALQILDLIENLHLYVKPSKEYGELIKGYMNENNVSLWDLKEYFKFYPDIIYKNMYEMGIIFSRLRNL